MYSNCAELYKSGKKVSGVYKIDPDGLGEFEVYYDQTTACGGWTVFQKRMDGSVDFYRGWDDYKRGFGKLTGEFWLGLDKIYRLTASSGNKLRLGRRAEKHSICRVQLICCGWRERELHAEFGKLFRYDDL